MDASAEIRTDDLPNLEAWTQRIMNRPAVQRGLNVPHENTMLKAMKVCSNQDSSLKVDELYVLWLCVGLPHSNNKLRHLTIISSLQVSNVADSQ